MKAGTAHSKVARALPPARDLLGNNAFMSSGGGGGGGGFPEHDALVSALRRNANFKIKYGPGNAFHNHNAAHVTSVFRCGGGVNDISSIVEESADGLDGGEKVGDLKINADNWEEHLGDNGGVGLFGLGSEKNFAAYRTFFQEEIDKTDPIETVKAYFPRLAPGMLGDFFHAIIELGYYFESGEVSVLPNALAWLCTSYVELPPPPPPNTKTAVGSASSVDTEAELASATPLDALRTMSSLQSRFPKCDLNNGSSGYIHDMENLLSSKDYYATAVEYDLNINAANTKHILDGIQVAARESFAAGGYCDFYTLHSVTASRAVWAILTQMEWSPDVEITVLRTLWRGILLTHIVRNNFPLLPLDRPYVGTRDGGNDDTTLTPWETILEWVVATKNSHLVKVVFTFADFYDRTHDELYWNAAANVMNVRESGVSLLGVGVGSLIESYIRS